MSETNELYPIFLKVHELQVLIVGGGNVALEKLTFLLKSSPNAKVQLVAPVIRDEIRELALKHSIHLIERSYKRSLLKQKHLVIAATDNGKVNLNVYLDCKKRNLLVNVADTPQLCDFYFNSSFQKLYIFLYVKFYI